MSEPQAERYSLSTDGEAGALSPAIDWRRPWMSVPELLVVIAVGLLPAILFVNVITRYTGWARTPWASDASRICFLWASFLGAALAVKYDAHVRLALISDKIARAKDGRYWTTTVLLINASVMVVGGILGYVGWDIVEVSMKRTMSVLPIQRGYVDAALPISGLLMVYYSGSRIWNHFKARFSRPKLVEKRQ